MGTMDTELVGAPCEGREFHEVVAYGEELPAHWGGG